MHMLPRITLLCCALLISAAPTSRPALEVRCLAVAEEWKDKFATEELEKTVAPPFVIAGDLDRRTLGIYRDRTVVAAQKALEATFIKTPTNQPIVILLFKDADSYKRLAKQWFGYTDVPHYGFYRPSDRTMLMNISTGGGTLVHELTHALTDADFPDIPDWFNEGFASLYEQCNIDGDTITGLPNWRLPALQKAIRDKKLRPLAEMIADDDFRNDDRVGINYAHARYLMLYLQQRKQLPAYYKSFRDNFEDDPTGIDTLKKLIAPQSLEDFDREWQKWVLTLKFPA